MVCLMGFSGVLISEIPCKFSFVCLSLFPLTPCLVGEKRNEMKGGVVSLPVFKLMGATKDSSFFSHFKLI